MELKEAVLYLANNWASSMLAIVALAAFVVKVKPIGAALKRFAFAELYAANESQDRRLDNLEMQQLKQIICDRRLPDGERLNAGTEYIRRGGNGEIAMIYEAIREAAKKKRLEDRELRDREDAEKRRNA